MTKLKKLGTMPEEEVLSFEQIASKTANRLCRQSSLVGKTQVVSEEELHPEYSYENHLSFVREMYRLKGFAYLRN